MSPKDMFIASSSTVKVISERLAVLVLLESMWLCSLDQVKGVGLKT